MRWTIFFFIFCKTFIFMYVYYIWLYKIQLSFNFTMYIMQRFFSLFFFPLSPFLFIVECWCCCYIDDDDVDDVWCLCEKYLIIMSYFLSLYLFYVIMQFSLKRFFHYLFTLVVFKLRKKLNSIDSVMKKIALSKIGSECTLLKGSGCPSRINTRYFRNIFPIRWWLPHSLSHSLTHVWSFVSSFWFFLWF
jgi:hypothetical protein